MVAGEEGAERRAMRGTPTYSAQILTKIGAFMPEAMAMEARDTM
jgi:hypothetical protein